MILIIGGQAQGKLNYALKISGLKEDNVYNKYNFEPEIIKEKRIINNFHLIIRYIMENNKDYNFICNFISSLNKNTIIICNEIGCGIVPIDKFERNYREVTGKICIYIAEISEKVIRINCGIPSIIKQ